MKIFEELGEVALGTRIRFLGDKVTTDAAQIYGLYGIDMNPKWFPVFYELSKHSDRTITAIAHEIKHSHVSVSKIVSEMAKAGLVSEKASKQDGRRTMVSLTAKGHKIVDRIADQYIDVRAAVEEVSALAKHNLWQALGEWENLLGQKSLLDRVVRQKKLRESAKVKIVPYKAQHQAAFRRLNLEWITTYFKVEQADRDALDNPEGYILDRGGYIFVATIDDKPVGVCALLKRNDRAYPFELAKMAVSPDARGKNVGWLLGKKIIEQARALKAEKLYLESNTILKHAMGLYEKLGFKKIEGVATPYERCNIQMELNLKR